MRPPAGNHLEHLKALLGEGLAKGNILLLRDCEAGLTAILEALGRKPAAERAALAPVEAHLLEIRGRCLAGGFEIDGVMRRLERGLDDFRRAEALLAAPAHSQARDGVRANLATALVRYGEQTQRTGELREAIALLDAMLGGAGPDHIPPASREFHNSRAVAKSVLGSTTGDRALIRSAFADLVRLLRTPGLDKDLEVRVEKNMIAAMFENAVLSRNGRLHRELIKVLQRMVAPRDPDRLFFLTYLIRTKLDLSRIHSDLELIREAVSALELTIPFIREESRSAGLPSALQTLAAACCELGKLEPGSPSAHFRRAVLLIDEAIALHPPRTSESAADARVTRLIADSGAFRFMLGRETGDAAMVEEALREYRRALEGISPESSPRMFFRVSAGQFEAEFLLGRWPDALDSFANLERAWRIVGWDRLLSSQVHDQRVTDMADHHAKAAHCHLMQGETAAAVEVLERGRAQEARMTLSATEIAGISLGPEARALLEDTARAWEKARRDPDPAVCREAWRRYIDARQSSGLHGAGTPPTFARIMERVPVGGALVYLTACERRVDGLALIRGEPAPRRIVFPEDAWFGVGRLIHGSRVEGTHGWATAYERFKNHPDDEGGRFLDWEFTVAEGLETLGFHLMDPVHRLLTDAGLGAGSPVLISPTGDIAALPLAHAQLADGSAFGEHWAASLVPNAEFVGKSPAGGPPSGHRLLIISDDGNAAGQSDVLPYACREAAALEERFRGGPCLRLKGAQATVGALIDHMPHASIIHVACHGSYDQAFPANSGIHLSPASKLEMSRLRQSPEWKLDCRLVFLSCCESGISGRTVPADEFVGLLTSFLACGAKAAIGALWPVHDDAAMVLCRKFYQRFLDDRGRERMPPAQALSEAQAWLRRVPLRELVDEGFLETSEALDLAEARLISVRRRGVARDATPDRPPRAPRKPSSTEWTRTLGSIRLYESPVDWAAFVLVGS